MENNVNNPVVFQLFVHFSQWNPETMVVRKLHYRSKKGYSIPLVLVSA